MALLLAALALLSSAATTAPGDDDARPPALLPPVRLRTDHAAQPLSIQHQRPRLSWALMAVSPATRGLRQAAFQLQLSDATHQILWDSGKVASNRTVLEHCCGAAPAVVGHDPVIHDPEAARHPQRWDTIHGRGADDDVMVVQELTQQDRTAAARASQIDVDDVRADGGAPGSSWQQLAAALAQQDRTAAARINLPPSTATRAAGGAPAAAAAASCGTVATIHGAVPVKSEPAGGGESAESVRVLVARYKKAIAVRGETRPLKGLLKGHSPSLLALLIWCAVCGVKR